MENRTVDLGSVVWLSDPCGENDHTLVLGHVASRVSVRIVVIGFGNTGLEVVRNHEVQRHSCWSQSLHIQVGVASFTSDSSADRDALSSPVNENPLVILSC